MAGEDDANSYIPSRYMIERGMEKFRSKAEQRELNANMNQAREHKRWGATLQNVFVLPEECRHFDALK